MARDNYSWPKVVFSWSTLLARARPFHFGVGSGGEPFFGADSLHAGGGHGAALAALQTAALKFPVLESNLGRKVSKKVARRKG